MKVEATLIHQLDGGPMSKTGCAGELKSWEKLLSPRFLRRTMVGVMIMVFQRKWLFHDHSSLMSTSMENNRMEWYQCFALLWTHSRAKHRVVGGYLITPRVRRYWNNTVLGRPPGYFLYRQIRCVAYLASNLPS